MILKIKGLKNMSKKNKWIYIILALLFGGFGIHKLYEGMPFKFVLYIFFLLSRLIIKKTIRMESNILGSILVIPLAFLSTITIWDF